VGFGGGGLKVSVVLPVYNEEEAIGEVLEETISTLEGTSYDWEIIVVDDGSKDRTAEIVASFPQATLLRHPHNMGGGRARNTGIKAASGEVVVIADGDGTYPLRDIPRLVEELKDCDMVVGARKKEAGTLKFLRVPVKFLIRKLAEFISGSKIPDLNSGMRAIRRDAVSPYLRMLPPGHSWVSTITLAFLNNGHVVKYVPIDYYPRKGKSTFHPIRDTGNYIMTIFRTITWFSPLTASTVVLLLGGLQVLALGLIADMIAKRSGL
jgi:glycosyltransferase involved in cell wall biosynthesis